MIDLPYGEANPADVLDAVSTALLGRGAEVRRVDRDTVLFVGPAIGADPANTIYSRGTDFAWLVSGGSVSIEPIGPVESVRVELRFSPVTLLVCAALAVLPSVLLHAPPGARMRYAALGLVVVGLLFLLASGVMSWLVLSGLRKAY
jgi:hypothetical protein